MDTIREFEDAWGCHYLLEEAMADCRSLWRCVLPEFGSVDIFGPTIDVHVITCPTWALTSTVQYFGEKRWAAWLACCD
jgi:hypothetical protein